MDKTMLKFRFEAYKRKAKEVIKNVVDKLKVIVNAVVEFAKEYPLQFAAMLMAAAGGGMKLVRRHDQKQAMRFEETKRERQIYDRSEGHYWTMKRRPTPEEWGEIRSRKQHGETYYDILKGMGLM